MRHILLTLLAIVAIVFTGCGGGGSGGSGKTVRIMPLGDSITYDYANAYYNSSGKMIVPIGKRTGYRSFLAYNLDDAGVKYDFVGSRRAGYDVTPKFDPDNEGYAGWTTWQIASHVYGFLSKNPADAILLHIGSNDQAGGRVDGIEKILNEIKRFEKDRNTKIKVFVALIINRWFWDRTIEKYNKNLKAMLARRNDPNIVVVDMSHLLSAKHGDYLEDYHPNKQGYKKMADKWFVSLMDNLF